MTRLLFILLLFQLSCQSTSITEVDRFNENTTYQIVSENLYQPWSVKYGKDGHLWVTENTNLVSRVNPGSGEILPVNVEIEIIPEEYFAFFVHGIEFHSSFPDSPFVYLSYLYLEKNDTATSHMDVVRLVYDSIQNKLSQPHYILKDLNTPGKMIIGGRLLVNDSFLYIASSDETIEIGSSQDTSLLTGKILRYNLDGSIPSSNPFSNSPIFSFGHRNPQGLTMYEGNLYTSEHGPSDNDEINKITPGGNYGWPVYSGSIKYKEEDPVIPELKLPIYSWTPTVAPSSLACIKFKGNNYFLLPTLKEADLRLLKFDKDDVVETAILFNEKFGRIRDVLVTPENEIFILTYNRVQGNLAYYHTPKKDSTYNYDLLIQVKLDE